MRINVVGRQFDITDPIRTHAEARANKLDEKYPTMIQQIDVVVRKENSAVEEYAVELVVDVEHRDDFIATATGPDLYATIDDAGSKADRQLHDHREKLKINR